ncbi:MAG: hypothetical protein ACI4NE_08440 [Succinivibrio sp.]
MFNLLMNSDGRVSYFRLTCLCVALGCFVCGCVMDKSETSTVSADDINDKSPVTASVQSEEMEAETAVDDIHQLRKTALKEFIENNEYLQTCGAIDHSFENCSLSLSQSLEPYYKLKLDASIDGYMLVLEAKSENKDTCRVFEADSNGELYGYDQDGKRDPACTMAGSTSTRQFKIIRDTDAARGQSAPSGLSPLVQDLSLRK